MKHVFDTDEIAHLWMHKTQDDARNKQGNFYFEGDTIYSYGSHFPIAKHVTNKKGEAAILFTTRGYSNTTSKHLYAVRNAIPAGVRVFHVQTPSDFEHSQLTNWQSRIKTKAESVIAPKIRQKTRTERWQDLQKLVADANEFCVFFGVKPSFKLPASVEALADDLETERKRNEAKAKRDRAKQERLYRERIAREREESKPMIAAWVDGADRMPDGKWIDIPRSITEAYLRIEDDEVVTSKGAHFPISHARRGFAFVSALRAKGEAWQTNGHTFHIGHFRLDSVDEAGNVKAGCHFVEWSEIERFGKILAKVQDETGSQDSRDS